MKKVNFIRTLSFLFLFSFYSTNFILCSEDIEKKNLSEEEKQERIKRWNNLPPEKKQEILKRWEQFKNLTPEQRKNLFKNRDKFKNLPPEKKKEFEKRFNKLMQIKNKFGQNFNTHFEKIRKLPPKARKDLMLIHNFLEKLPDDEKQIIITSKDKRKTTFDILYKYYIETLSEEDLKSFDKLPQNKKFQKIIEWLRKSHKLEKKGGDEKKENSEDANKESK